MNTSDIKIFFFDIDSTTFDHSIFAVRKTTMDALKLLKESGYKICISTSRSIAEMQNLPLEFTSMMDAIISSAGASIEIGNKKILRTFNKNELVNVLSFMDSHNITYRYTTLDGTSYLNQSNQEVENLFYRLYHMTPILKPYANEDVIHINYYDFNEDIIAKITHLLPSCSHVNMDKSNEISPFGSDKGTGIISCAKEFGFSKENICSFGDSLNDVPMFENSALSICLGNAKAECKKKATYVTDTISNDGLYNALIHFGFIK